MAAIFTRVQGANVTEGTLRGPLYDITFDANYATGGVALDPDSAGLVGQIVGLIPVGLATPTGVAVTSDPVVTFDFKIQKLQLWGAAGSANGLTELGAISLAGFVIRAQVFGF